MVSRKNPINKPTRPFIVGLRLNQRVEERSIGSTSKERPDRTRSRRKKRCLWPHACKAQAIHQRAVPKEKLRKIAKVLRELHLPMLGLETNKPNHSTRKWAEPKRWPYWDMMQSMYDLWDNVRYSTEQESPLRVHASSNGPHWNEPPTKLSDLGVLDFVHRFKDLTRHLWSLQVPSHWPVFAGVSWNPRFFDRGRIDSTVEEHSDGCAAREVGSLFDGYFSPGESYEEEKIHSRARGFYQSRIRRFWTCMSAFSCPRFRWEYQTQDRAVCRDQRRHVGFLDMNQGSMNYDIWPQASMEAFLGILSLSEGSEQWHLKPEIDWPIKLGRIYANLVATDLFPAQSQQRLHWPAFLSRADASPIVDYACCARMESIGWPEDIHLLLFATCYGGPQVQDPYEQLAKAFQPMMTIFTLYHLDRRKSRDEPMPSWMVLFGIVYDGEGLTIQANFPFFKPPAQGSVNVDDWGWGALSTVASTEYDRIGGSEPDLRGGCLATISRIQGHCKYVLEMLRAWDGFERASSKFLAS